MSHRVNPSLIRYLADDIFKCVFMNERCYIFTQLPRMFVPKGPFDNKSILVQAIAWAPHRWQAIIWNNADLVHWRIYAALGGCELIIAVCEIEDEKKIPWSAINSWALRWRHNGRDSVSNHQPHDCLLNRLFRRRSKKTSKRRVTGLCAGNSPGTGDRTNGQ